MRNQVRGSVVEVLAEAEAVAVAVEDVEIAAAVFLVADGADYVDAFLLELGVEGVGVVDPEVGVPGEVVGVRGAGIGAHLAWGFELAEHEVGSAAMDDGEAGRLAPEALVAEAELVAVEVCGG